MLAVLDHKNVVMFVGYCLDPALLIVMEFVEGGTLSEFVANQDPEDPPTMKILMKILSGSARGL